MAFFCLSKTHRLTGSQSEHYKVELGSGLTPTLLQFSDKRHVRRVPTAAEDESKDWILALHLPFDCLPTKQLNNDDSWRELCNVITERSLSAIAFRYEADERRLSIFLPSSAYQKIYVQESSYDVELGSLVSLLSGPLRRNESTEFFFLSFQFAPEPATLFAGISELNDSGIWTISDGRLSHEDNPTTDATDDLPLDSSNAVDYLHEQLVDVLRVQTAQQDRVAVMLGGFDSALIVSILSQLGKEVTAYTFAYDESQHQQKNLDFVADLPGVQHRWVKITPDVFLYGMQRYSQMFSMPVTQPHYLIFTQHLASVIAKDNHKVCLTGDGCDGAFFGYPTVLKKGKFVERLRKLPSFLCRLGHAVASLPLLENWMGQPVRIARDMLDLAAARNRRPPFLQSRAFDASSYQRMFQVDSVPDLQDRIDEISTSFQHLEYFQQIYRGKNFVGLNKAKLAACQNTTGLLMYSPYLDKRIKRLGESFPVDFWLRDGKGAGSGGKYLLARLAREKNILPDSVIDQPKMSPVSSPLEKWLREEFPHESLATIQRFPLQLSEKYIKTYFKRKSVEEWYKRRVTVDHFTMQNVTMMMAYAALLSPETAQQE